MLKLMLLSANQSIQLPSYLHPGCVIGQWEQSYREREREGRIRKKKKL